MTEPVLSTADVTSFIHQAIPMLGKIGLEVVAMGPGRMTLRVPFEGNQNHVGTMYAGVLFSIAEVPGGALAVQLFDPARFYPVIKDMSVQYLRPARSDVTVAAEITPDEVRRILAETESQGKSEFVMELAVTDADGVVVMTSTGHYQLRARL